MISKVTWQLNYKKEIEHAIQARAIGNEGMARVCARRAAGIVIGEYLLRHGVTVLTNSAYDRLILFRNLPTVDEQHKAISAHFLIKVNHDHHLPGDTDLIQDALWLKETLLDNT